MHASVAKWKGAPAVPREARPGVHGAQFGEGARRGLSMGDVARLLSWNPAQRYGLRTKGALAEGFDADIALVDDTVTWTVRAEASESTQEYTPFEGFEMRAAVTDTFLRGHRVLEDGAVVGEPTGRYLSRPTGR